jgi:GDPmannose 4,6-dehydratase
MNNKKTALIVGVSGQDGTWLAKLLLEKGYRVVGTSRDSQANKFENLTQLGILERLELLSTNLTDFRSVLQTLTAIQPDEVYNLAGQSSVGLSFEQPVETIESIVVGNLNLLECIRHIGADIRLYSAGSGECFGNSGDQPANEQTAFRPCSPYAVAKSAAFWQVANYREAYSLRACTGVLFNHESPLRPERFVTRKIVSAACRIAAGSDEKLKLGNTSIRRDWGWAPEYVGAMWLMLQQEELQDLVIATGVNHGLDEFLVETFRQVGLDWQDHVEHDPALFRPSDIQANCGDPSRAHDVLGWKAQVGFNKIIERMVEAEQAVLAGNLAS